jgi:hypothetical protein
VVLCLGEQIVRSLQHCTWHLSFRWLRPRDSGFRGNFFY